MSWVERTRKLSKGARKYYRNKKKNERLSVEGKGNRSRVQADKWLTEHKLPIPQNPLPNRKLKPKPIALPPPPPIPPKRLLEDPWAWLWRQL